MPQAVDQDLGGQRASRFDEEIQERRDTVQVRTGYAGTGLGDGRYLLSADRREANPRRRVVGDVL